MSYLLVISISLIFLFLWSKLPDPTGPQPETRNSLPDRESNAMQSAKTGETRGPKLHPDRLGRPDDDGRIRLFPHGDVQGRADGRQAITATAVRSVQGVQATEVTGTFLSHGRERDTITSSGRCGTTISNATTG